MKVLLICLFFFFFDLQAIEDDWDRVYLATFPRSGNHWMRYLLEEATHITTSSAYQPGEINHLPELFPWGAFSTKSGYYNNCKSPRKKDPIVIKTHFPVFPSHYSDEFFHRLTIRIVRNPIDCCWSLFEFQFKHFNPNIELPKMLPQVYLDDFIYIFKNFNSYWDSQPNCFTIRYEDMLENPEKIFKEVINLIGYNVTEVDIQRALQKHPPKNYELQHLDHFTQHQKNVLSAELGSYLIRYNYKIPKE